MQIGSRLNYFIIARQQNYGSQNVQSLCLSIDAAVDQTWTRLASHRQYLPHTLFILHSQHSHRNLLVFIRRHRWKQLLASRAEVSRTPESRILASESTHHSTNCHTFAVHFACEVGTELVAKMKSKWSTTASFLVSWAMCRLSCLIFLLHRFCLWCRTFFVNSHGCPRVWSHQIDLSLPSPLNCQITLQCYRLPSSRAACNSYPKCGWDCFLNRLAPVKEPIYSTRRTD